MKRSDRVQSTEQCRNCKKQYLLKHTNWSYYACECFSVIKCNSCRIFNHFCDERICTSCIIKAEKFLKQN